MKTHPFILYPLPAAAECETITFEPINIMMMLECAHHSKAGGVVLFSGEVRDHHAGKEVSHLEYEAYESLAEKMIQEIVQTAKQKWNLHYAAAVHRMGMLGISESAVVVVTSHAHRKEAYAANQYIIDRIKHEAPIWKCEYYSDGSYEWSDGCR